MRRREFMTYTVVGALAAAVRGRTAPEHRKPNILFILGDDVTYNTLGCYGGKNVKTPNIDRLASQGMRFTRAYGAMSMCAPFRAELYTGLYPVRSGVARNHTGAKEGTRSVCHYLGDLNYRVGIAGKVHASPQSVFPFERIQDRSLAGEGVRGFITRDAKQPFCLFCCSNNAHPPWRSGDVSRIDSNAVKLPPLIHDNPPTRKTFIGYLAEVAELDREVGQVLTLLDECGRADDTLVMFSSEQGWDFGFGKWTNWDIGLHSALIACWPGRVKAGSVSDALVQMADVLPTFIAAAGGDAAAKLDGTSFLPVLVGRSTTHRTYVYGVHNNWPEGTPYPIRSIRDERFHYLMNLKHTEPYHEKHLMSEGLARRYDLQWWKAMSDAAQAGDKTAKKLMDKFHHRPAEELYLVDKDPYELNNLAADPTCAAVKKRLRAELERWMAEQKDTGAAMDVPRPPKPKRRAAKKTPASG